MRTPSLLLITAISCGPKKPVGDAATDLFPLVEGATWTYQTTFNGREGTETKLAVPIALADGEAWAFVTAEDRDASVAMVGTNMFGLGVYRRTAAGIETAELQWRSDAGDVSKDTFQPMLATPPAPGATATWQTRNVDRSSVTVVGWESLTVPAGTFDPALRLDLGGKGQAWLAPGVGLLKWELVTGRVEELTEWTIPAP